ncbi:acyl-CoA dehydrogenase family protein, partial [Rhodobacteraceae bacterium]|nr:acyl-CoA dehydrogenase family protein [Paracoccaceae bacterium]
GSDVRANTTRASALTDGGYALTGHKWFCSAPMSDGFLTLAYLDEQMTCFLVPRVLADGSLNTINVMRLKNKLGNIANASSEIEYHGAWAQRIGDPGNGVKSILDMVHHTRLGAVAATLGIMRMALAQAINHTMGRSAFQRRLIDQPLMRAVLADLQVEYEAAVAMVIHIAARFGSDAPEERAYIRLAVALAKYLLTKRCPNFVYECLECHGGGGYIQDGPMARLYREAPLNAIWEGSGNVIALDVLRTIAKEPAALDAYLDQINRFDSALRDEIAEIFKDGTPPENTARFVAEKMALTLQTVLLQDAPSAILDAHRQNLSGVPRTYGGGSPGVDIDHILKRAEFRD